MTSSTRQRIIGIEATRYNRAGAILILMDLVVSGFFVLWAAGCQNGPPRPVEILPEDACGYCRMAISERRFAAEFIDRDGIARKFDDIGCLLAALKRESKDTLPLAIYVVDYERRAWIEGEQACFVRSSELKTPMGGGLAAFQDCQRAEAAAINFKGRVLRFTDL